jgi:hypothetical protein
METKVNLSNIPCVSLFLFSIIIYKSMNKIYLYVIFILVTTLISCKSTDKLKETTEPVSGPGQVEGAVPSHQEAIDAGSTPGSDDEIERAGGVPELTGDQVVEGSVKWLRERLVFPTDVSDKVHGVLMETFITSGGKPEEKYPKPQANAMGKSLIRNASGQLMEFLNPDQQAEFKQLLLNQ